MKRFLQQGRTPHPRSIPLDDLRGEQESGFRQFPLPSFSLLSKHSPPISRSHASQSTVGIGDVEETVERILPLAKRHSVDITAQGELRCYLIPLSPTDDPTAVFARHSATISPATYPAPTQPPKLPMKPEMLEVNLASPSPGTPLSLSSSSSSGSVPEAKPPSPDVPVPQESPKPFFRSKSVTLPTKPAKERSALSIAFSKFFESSPVVIPSPVPTSSSPDDSAMSRSPLSSSPLPVLSTPRRSRRPVHSRKSSAPASSPSSQRQLARGLVDVFFVAGAQDVLADLADRISDMGDSDQLSVTATVDPYTVAYSGEILDVFPAQSWDEIPSSAWMFCMPEGLLLARGQKPDPVIFPFVLTAENGSKKYATCLRVHEALDYETTVALSCRCPAGGTPQVAYVPRFYCLLSAIPCFTFCREWLAEFATAASAPGYCLEACVCSLKSVPLPIPAGAPLKITFDGRPLTDVQLPPAEGLPFLDVPLRILFKSLSVESILTVFRCLLLEEKMFLISSFATFPSFDHPF